MSKTTVIYHSADFDGIFCREIARKFLGNEGVEYIGWNHGDAPLPIPDGRIYVMDLPVDRVFGFFFDQQKTIPPLFATIGWMPNIIWIDHHKSAIAAHPDLIPGYRIDGVAACRLAWQWFALASNLRPGLLPLPEELPDLLRFKDRQVLEPRAVRLAGEYDVWDKRDPEAEVFQFALRSRDLEADDWADLLEMRPVRLFELLSNGRLLQRYQQGNDANIVNHRSFLVTFMGLKFLALNTPRCNSLTFAARDVLDTGHDALMGFYFTGKEWSVSLYHARHRPDLDLSAIAVLCGGGGHRGACGFQASSLYFLEAVTEKIQ